MRGDRLKISILFRALVLACVSQGCATDPPPIVIHEDPSESVWLKFDPRSGAGHSHPATVSAEVMASALRGIRVRGRDVVGGFGYFADQDSAPAFLPMDIPDLASRLSLALSKASPKDMATFYLARNDLNRGKVITSGGVFVRGKYLMVILANAHSSLYGTQYENTSTIDTKGEPLLPIARFKFTAEFSPPDVRIPNKQVQGDNRYEGYFDNSKLLALDLTRLRGLEDVKGSSQSGR